MAYIFQSIFALEFKSFLVMVRDAGQQTRGYEATFKSLDTFLSEIPGQEKALAEEKRAAEKAAAQELADKIKEFKTVIKTKGGEGGRLFGSITSKDISEAVAEQHKLNIDKKKIVLDAPIKNCGTYEIPVKLYTEVTGVLNVTVEIQ